MALPSFSDFVNCSFVFFNLSVKFFYEGCIIGHVRLLLHQLLFDNANIVPLAITPKEIMSAIRQFSNIYLQMADNQYEKKGDRLKIIRMEIGMSQDLFSQFLGITQGHLSAMERGTKNISHRVIALLADKIPALDINYLITGKGTLWKSKPLPDFSNLSTKKRNLTEFTRPEKAVYGYTEDELEPHQVNEPITIHNTVRNVMVGIGLQESYVAGWDDEERAKNTVTAILPGLRGDVRTFQISGESMRPALEDGDWIACRPATIATIKEGHMYAIVHKELIVSVKYVYRYVGGLLLVPANRQVYKPITIEEGEVIEIWEAALRLTSRLTQLPQLGAWQDQERKITQLEQFIKNLFPDYGELDGDI